MNQPVLQDRYEQPVRRKERARNGCILAMLWGRMHNSYLGGPEKGGKGKGILIGVVHIFARESKKRYRSMIVLTQPCVLSTVAFSIWLTNLSLP